LALYQAASARYVDIIRFGEERVTGTQIPNTSLNVSVGVVIATIRKRMSIKLHCVDVAERICLTKEAVGGPASGFGEASKKDVQRGGTALKEFFGIPESEKEVRQRISREIRRKGAAGEEIVRMNYAVRNYKVTRTGRGSDFHVEKRDLLRRVVDSKDIEVKTGRSHLSELQEETKRKRRGHYKVERVEPPPFFYQDL
jgi:hypothetical protein